MSMLGAALSVDRGDGDLREHESFQNLDCYSSYADKQQYDRQRRQIELVREKDLHHWSNKHEKH